MADDDEDFRPTFVGQEENLADLSARIAPDDRQLYSSFGCIFTEAAFFNRRFIVIKTMGRNGGVPKQPQILGSVRVLGYECDHERGTFVTLMEESSSRSLRIGYVPTRLFRFPIFVSVPVFQGVKWEAKEHKDGSYQRNLVFGLCFKQQSNIKFYNRDNVAVLTPNEYRKHFGDTLPRF